MNQAELLQILTRGEDSRHQFKRDATNSDGLVKSCLDQAGV